MGKRAGRGRPVEVPNSVDFGVRCSADVVERIDRLADKIGISRAQMVRNLLEVALEDAEVLESMGIFTIASWVNAMKESLLERRRQVLQTV